MILGSGHLRDKSDFTHEKTVFLVGYLNKIEINLVIILQ